MRLKYAIGALVAATSLAALAAGDKLTIISEGYPIYSQDIENLDNVSYLDRDRNNPGYSHIVFKNNAGIQTAYSMDYIDEVKVRKPLPENPLKVTYDLHHTSVTFHIDAPEGVYYRFNGVTDKMFEGIDPSAMADALVENDIRYIKSVNAQIGKPLDQTPITDIFEYGGGKRDWFPPEIITGNTHLWIALYTAKIENNDIVVTSEPLLFDLTTKEIVDIGMRFNLTTEFNSTSMTVKAEPIAGEGFENVDLNQPYAIALYTAEEFVSTSTPQLISTTIGKWEQMIYSAGSNLTWDDFTFVGPGETTYSNMLMGDVYVAVAFGLEYGVPTTDLSYIPIEIPEPAILDDCQFTTVAHQLKTDEVLLDVTPTNDDTKWVTFLVDQERIDNLGPKQYIANRIWYYKYTNQINFENYIHTGSASLSSRNDMIDGIVLEGGKEYVALTCGLADDYGRITEISETPILTEKPEPVDMTFDLYFSDFKDSDSWFHELTYKITPSLPDHSYICEIYKKSIAKMDGKSDEQFIKDYIDINGAYIRLRENEFEQRTLMYTDWGSDTFETHILFFFGYEGGQTTPLYAFEIDPETGDVVQVRGPKVNVKFEQTFKIKIDDVIINPYGSADIKFTIIPKDKESKYYAKLFSVNSSDYRNSSDEEFISDYGILNAMNNLYSHKGDYSGTENYWSFGTMKDQLLVIYGYEETDDPANAVKVTTPVYAVKINLQNGEYEQVRGPEGALVIDIIDPEVPEGEFFLTTFEFDNAPEKVDKTAIYTVYPADKDMPYARFTLKADSDAVDLSLDDDAFLAKILSQFNIYNTHMGKSKDTDVTYADWDPVKQQYFYKDRLLFVFGYDKDTKKATTRIYVYEFNAEKGTYKLIRGQKE